MSQHDQRCTPFRQNVRDLWAAIKTGGRIGHELKNVVVEEWRRWTGKCPKEKDEHEPDIEVVNRPGPPSMDFAKRVERLLKEDESKESGV